MGVFIILHQPWNEMANGTQTSWRNTEYIEYMKQEMWSCNLENMLFTLTLIRNTYNPTKNVGWFNISEVIQCELVWNIFMKKFVRLMLNYPSLICLYITTYIKSLWPNRPLFLLSVRAFLTISRRSLTDWVPGQMDVILQATFSN